MIPPDYLAQKVAEIELVIEDLESVADTPGDLEALTKLSELRDRLATARDQYQSRQSLYL